MYSLENEIAWLRMEVDQYKREEAQFNRDGPLYAGTDKIQKIVPPLPPASLRVTVSSASLAGYLFIADAWYFMLNALLQEDSVVLDIGCGCGKMARLMVANPRVKKYVGFDNFLKNIEWCQQHIVPFDEGRFEFQHLDVYSAAYAPQGTLKGTDVKFPASDRSIDLVLASSLFTHLLEDDAKHYLKETKRVLKDGGRALLTIHSNPATGTRYSGTEVRIDVDQEYFVTLAKDAGLRCVEKLGVFLGQDAYLFAG